MDNVFPYVFYESGVRSEGKILINRLKESYHTNYEYFLVEFIEGFISIEDCNKHNMYERNIEKVKSVFALKVGYIENESLSTNDYDIIFYNKKNVQKNNYKLMIVNTDVENKLKDKLLLKSLLDNLVEKIFIGNEKYLLKIK